MFGIFLGRPPALERVDLSGQDAVVTGASTGIGLETARYLAAWGAKVTVVGRDVPRTRKAAEAVAHSAREAGIAAPDVAGLTCDFGSLASVRELSRALLDRHARLHVLVNNAGCWLHSRQDSAEGHEMTFAVNHLAPFLLTRELLPRITATGSGRIVTVSSRLHVDAPALDPDLLRAPARYSGIGAYAASKLCNVMFAAELAERLKGTGVTSNAVHPGDVATEVTRSSKVLSFLSDRVGRPLLLTPEEGARTSVHVATAPGLATTTGRYFAACREARHSRHVDDPALRRRLWEVSERLTSA
jgi:NAD(P)-dependent dehydrogenase (short-subunit alcohol dehydrogenase family)